MNKNDLKVILLVAGEGKRLRPFTNNCPKCMVELDGISLIDRQLTILQLEGIKNIVMIGGYKSEMLKRESITLKINSRYFETNMVWTLKNNIFLMIQRYGYMKETTLTRNLETG